MAPNSDDEAERGSYSLAKDRSRREKRGSKASARAELLAKIKNARETGEKFVREEEEDNVYELVDDEEYSDIVKKRQDDNWIVDDGTGYVEDGREIFDEDHNEQEDDEPSGGRKSKGSKKKNPNIRKPGAAASITSMFAASAAKIKSKPKADLAKHDDILEELLAKADGSVDGDVTKAPVVKPGIKRKQPIALFTKRPVKPVVVKPSYMDTSSLPDDSQRSDISSCLASQSQSQNISQASSSQRSDPHVIPASYEMEDSVDTKPVLDSMEVDDVTTGGDGFDDDFDVDDDQLMEIATAMKKEEKRKPKIEFDMSTSWMVNEEKTTPTADIKSETSVTPSSASGLPLVNNGDAEQVFRFYWLDAYEDYYKHPGSVYLFGKTKTDSGAYVSCCVAIKNIYRQVFLLPRQHRYDPKAKELTDETVAFLDVYNEFNDEIAPKFRIKNFKSKPSDKQYSFDMSDVPSNAEYLEVRYGCEYPALPKDLYGETFSHVFGTNKSSLELFLLEQKIKGPCWLDISKPKMNPHSASWCKHDVIVSDFKTIKVTPEEEKSSAPPLVTLTMSVKSLHNTKTNQNEVVQVACLINSEYCVDKPPPEKVFHDHFLAVTKTSDLVFPLDMAERAQTEGKQLKMEVLASERALLGYLLAKIHKYDPDILIGHDISNFELDFLMNRVSSTKVPHWHKIGRLKRSGDIPRRGMGKSTQIDKSVTAGRIVCDTMISARELIRAKSYNLTELVSQVLRQKRDDVEPEQLKAAYSDTTELLRVSNLTVQDAFYSHKLMFELNVLPLAWQITTICGNVLSRTLLGGRSERNEYLLLHAFTERGFIVPDKSYGGANKDKNTPKAPAADGELDDDEMGGARQQPAAKGKRKPAYAGGLVLEPKKGFYDTFILMLDFNSLYPSIIQEYNVCFTTVNRTLETVSQDDEMAIPDFRATTSSLGSSISRLKLTYFVDIPDSSLALGILPVEIRKLVQSRKQVKGLMKEKGLTKDQYMQYDIRQKALKLTANSMYGCLGFTFSRFYAKPLAALITAKGREILQKTKDLVEKMGLDVIYGDTDSIMINTNSRNFEEVFKLGNKVKAEVNKAYRLLEIDIDGVYKSMLLLKKKKYAALNVSKGTDGQLTTSQELKGLDIVRRDWCELSKQTGLYVVNEILSGENKETILENIHGKLREVKEAVQAGEIPLDLYYITKSLTKAPEAYPDKKSLPHVQVALRLNSGAAKKMRAGDTVYYIICQDGSSLPASQRAYHPDEMSRNDQLKVDTEYYLAHQIHPVVSRLCDPIEGTDSALIAEMLGLDSSRYHHKVQEDEEGDETHARLLSEEERYKLCTRLEIVCQHKGCGRKNIIDSPLRSQGKDYLPSWEFCAAMKPDGSPDHRLQLSTLDKENSSNIIENNINLLKNKLSIATRKQINQYYQGWLKCEDLACGHRTRRVPLQLYRGRPVCPQCSKAALIQEYTESMLYDQLCFYKYLFDHSKRPKSSTNSWSVDMMRLYSEICGHMDQKLSRSAYGYIDLHKLFSKIIIPGSVLNSNTTQG